MTPKDPAIIYLREAGYGPKVLSRTVKLSKDVDLGSSGPGLPPLTKNEFRHDQVAGLVEKLKRGNQ
jgi:hypothetical protein